MYCGSLVAVEEVTYGSGSVVVPTVVTTLVVRTGLSNLKVGSGSLHVAGLGFEAVCVGGIIGWIHDISDVFIAASRFNNSVNLKTATVLSYVGIMTTWQWTRTGLLPFYFYHTLFNCKWEAHPYFAKWLYCELVFLGIL